MRRFLAPALLSFSLFCLAVRAQTAAPQASPEKPQSSGQTEQGEAKAVVPLDKPLPRMDDMIARVKAHTVASEDLRKSYTYKQTVVADEFDSHGNKKGTHTDEYQGWMVKDVTLRQHLAHDGKPLPPDQEQKEQDRVNKEIASIKEGGYNRRPNGPTLSVANLLKVATFFNERRVDVNGRPTIQWDYTGDPKAKASDLGEEVMKKLTGELWVDEEDAAVVRMRGKLNENFHVAGGLLVNVKAGSWFDLYTHHVNGEIWFVQHLQAHADGRFLLFKGFDGDANVTFSDYRKMKTSVTILPGSQVVDEDGKPIPGLQVEPDTPVQPPIKPQP